MFMYTYINAYTYMHIYIYISIYIYIYIYSSINCLGRGRGYERRSPGQQLQRRLGGRAAEPRGGAGSYIISYMYIYIYIYVHTYI